MVVRGGIGVLAAAVAVAGCYDLERLDPGPESYYLLVDDFEDGNAEPDAPQFNSWRTAPFDTGGNYDLTHGLGTVGGNGSKYAFFVEFELKYPNSQAYNGISLETRGTGRDPLDARVFRNFNFSARFVPGAPFPDVTEFYVQLGCDGVHAGGPFWVERNIELGPEWRAQTLSIDAFSEPSNVPPQIEGGAPACLAVVDRIGFTVATNLEPTESVNAFLYIDDVNFE